MGEPKTFWTALDHRARRLAHSVARRSAWRLQAKRWPEPRRYSPQRDGSIELPLGSISEPLQRADPFAEPGLEAGKIVNVTLAASAFDGIVIAPERPLSFWR